MAYVLSRTRLSLFLFIITIPFVLLGCGGGGGASSLGSGDNSDTNTRSGSTAPRFVRLNTYNTWEFGNTSESASVLDQRLELLAKHECINLAEFEEWPNDVLGWRKLTPTSIKAINPKSKVYRHWGTVKNVNESDWEKDNTNLSRERLVTPIIWKMIEDNDWWLRDGNGNKVDETSTNDPSRYGMLWFIDLGKPGVKEAYLQMALARMEGKGFDGVLFDGAMQKLTPVLNGRPFPTQSYKNDEDWYRRAWQPFMEYVVKGFRSAGYRVIQLCGGQYGTSDAMQQWNRTQVDGVVYEQGAVGWQGEWLPGSWMEERINAIANDPLEVWVADGGLSLNNTGSEYERKRTVSLAMYYVAVPQSQAKRSYHHKYDGKVFWDSLWDFYIGEPAEAMVKQQGAYFWSRKYSQGMVLLNYENSRSISYTLDGKYKDMSGKEYSGTVTLPAHTALILAKS